MAAQVQPSSIQSVTDLSERRRIIESALGTTLAEGVSPGPEVLALSERYVAGEITLQEMGFSGPGDVWTLTRGRHFVRRPLRR